MSEQVINTSNDIRIARTKYMVGLLGLVFMSGSSLYYSLEAESAANERDNLSQTTDMAAEISIINAVEDQTDLSDVDAEKIGDESTVYATDPDGVRVVCDVTELDGTPLDSTLVIQSERYDQPYEIAMKCDGANYTIEFGS